MGETVAKRNLDEISLLRPLLIVVLVFYHAFAIYGYRWPWPGLMRGNVVELYGWLDDFSYACMLEAFVFISGYVWAFQREDCKKRESFSQLFVRKFRRLMVPSLLFSLVYMTWFIVPGRWTAYTVVQVVCGSGHLWFLPTLFLCFLIGWAVVRRGVNLWLAVILSILSAGFADVVRIPVVTALASHVMYYLLFFLLGYAWRKYRLDGRKGGVWPLVLLWTMFVGCYLLVSFYLVLEYFQVCQVVKTWGRMLQAGLGVMALLLTARHVADRWKVPAWMVEVGKNCFGVYIFQQFILEILYYKTPLPAVVNEWWLPWIGMAATLALSLLLTWTIRRTPVGRKIL